MLTQKRLMAGTVIGAVVMAGGFANVHAQETDQPTRENEAVVSEEAEITTITGEIVDLHSYLRTDEAEKSEGDEGLLQALAADMPIALVAEPEGVVDRVLPGKQMYLVIFHPDNDESKSAYREARDLVGERVTLTGETFDRHGLHAISILATVEAASEDDETQASVQPE